MVHESLLTLTLKFLEMNNFG